MKANVFCFEAKVPVLHWVPKGLRWWAHGVRSNSYLFEYVQALLRIRIVPSSESHHHFVPGQRSGCFIAAQMDPHGDRTEFDQVRLIDDVQVLVRVRIALRSESKLFLFRGEAP